MEMGARVSTRTGYLPPSFISLASNAKAPPDPCTRCAGPPTVVNRRRKKGRGRKGAALNSSPPAAAAWEESKLEAKLSGPRAWCWPSRKGGLHSFLHAQQGCAAGQVCSNRRGAGEHKAVPATDGASGPACFVEASKRCCSACLAGHPASGSPTSAAVIKASCCKRRKEAVRSVLPAGPAAKHPPGCGKTVVPQAALSTAPRRTPGREPCCFDV